MSYIQKEYYLLKVPKQLYQTKSTNGTIIALLNEYMPQDLRNFFGIAYRENDDFPKEIYVALNSDEVQNTLRSMARNRGLALTLIHASPIVFTDDHGYAFIANAELFESRLL